MKFLVDANVLCEPTKPQCEQKAVDWLQTNVVDCVTDAVVMGEIWRGIERLPEGAGGQIWTRGSPACEPGCFAWIGRSMSPSFGEE